jgi:hypothetical protein
MSRLYSILDTDAIRTTHTARGHTSVCWQCNFGSAGNSKKAVSVNVFWPKDSEKPQIHITISKQLESETQECD